MKNCTILFAILFSFFLGNASLQGQNWGDEVKGETRKNNIGWGVNLGNIAFYNSAFQFGIAPNIAYKLSESTSVGFMLKMDYYYEKFRDFGNQKYSSFDLGPTAFIRTKPLWTVDGITPFLGGLFLQAEYERASIARPFLDNTGTIFAQREAEDYVYLGLGAASGYPFSTFVSIHYNIADSADHSRLPFNYRVGFTYNY